MNHPVDVAVEANEQTELGNVLEDTLDFAAHWMTVGEVLPWILRALLQTQANTALARIYV